jgi:hypothetical protein
MKCGVRGKALQMAAGVGAVSLAFLPQPWNGIGCVCSFRFASYPIEQQQKMFPDVREWRKALVRAGNARRER